MKVKSLSTIYIILIALVIYASMLILRHAAHPVTPNDQSPLDSIVVGATLWEYNETGKLTSKITAQKIEHFESQKNNTTLFIKPFIITYSDVNTIWHIHADQAKTDKTGDVIFFQGHVIFHELPTAKNPETTITTDRMTVYPKKSIGVTNDAVTIIHPGTVIHGKVLIAHFKTGQYELKSQSQATYLPQPHQKSP